MDTKADLAAFDLEPKDIDARPLTATDHNLSGLRADVQGYKIPFYDVNGKPRQHYRVRYYSVDGTSPAGFHSPHAQPWLYYPPNFRDAFTAMKDVRLASGKTVRPVVITLDERQACSLSTRHGWPAVAIEGAAGWCDADGKLAEGVDELVSLAVQDSLTFVFWVGDDIEPEARDEIAEFALRLKNAGLSFPQIRIFQSDTFSPVDFQACLRAHSRFPVPSNPRRWIAGRLSKPRLAREDYIDIALVMLADMDRRGIRVYSKSIGGYYFFDLQTRQFWKASLQLGGREMISRSELLADIQQRYGVFAHDITTLKVFSGLFTTEEPMLSAEAHRALRMDPRNANTVSLQLSSADFVHIGDPDDDTLSSGSEKKAHVVTNGTYRVLFDRDGVDPVDVEQFEQELQRQRRKMRNRDKMPCWWRDVLSSVSFDTSTGNGHAELLAVLYYISPWLFGWRGIQLPIELIKGEAGSGKTSLFDLRSRIISGVGDLKNAPMTMDSWQSMVANTSPMLIIDNMHAKGLSPHFVQAMSDEMCRIITRDQATVDKRQYYTTIDLARYPVRCTFGLTSIEDVFTRSDFVQRAVITNLEVRRNADQTRAEHFDWVRHQLERFGGREAWLAHHMLALERFFDFVREYWDEDYRSVSRLVNLEQALELMSLVFSRERINAGALLKRDMDKSLVQVDWVLEGIRAFAQERVDNNKTLRFRTSELCHWAESNEEYEDNVVLTNARRLGRYIQSNKSTVFETAGVYLAKSGHGKSIYEIDATQLGVNNE